MKMFMHNFDKEPTGIFREGVLPQIERISHTYNNPSWYYALHVHTEQVELMYVADGKATITLNQNVFQVEKGNLLLINKGMAHAIESSLEEPSDIWCCLMGNVEFQDSEEDHHFASVAKSGEFQNFINQTMRRLYDFSYQKGAAAQEICNHLSTCLVVLFRQLLLESNLSYEVKNPTFAQKVLVYINENYEKRIDLQHLSEVFYTSASHISREFKREYKISPINYLIDKRLSEAKWQLINTNETVYSIAERVGYDNYYYFSKLFHQRIGFLPTEYREKYKEEEADTTAP